MKTAAERQAELQAAARAYFDASRATPPTSKERLDVLLHAHSVALEHHAIAIHTERLAAEERHYARAVRIFENKLAAP